MPIIHPEVLSTVLHRHRSPILILDGKRLKAGMFAFDMGLFNNRIFLSADYYVKTTKDLLYQVTVPALLGFTKAWGKHRFYP